MARVDSQDPSSPFRVAVQHPDARIGTSNQAKTDLVGIVARSRRLTNLSITNAVTNTTAIGNRDEWALTDIIKIAASRIRRIRWMSLANANRNADRNTTPAKRPASAAIQTKANSTALSRRRHRQENRSP